MRTIYIHTIDDSPAVFSDGTICFAPFYGRDNRPAESLKQIRREQKANDEYCEANGIENAYKFGYIRYRVGDRQ